MYQHGGTALNCNIKAVPARRNIPQQQNCVGNWDNGTLIQYDTESAKPEEYHLVNSIFELIDKTKLITVILRLYFKVIVKPNVLQTKVLFIYEGEHDIIVARRS